VVEETVKFHNGMLVGVYELLLAQQAQVLTAKQYVEANKEFWLAWIDLERAVGGGVPAPQKTAASGTPDQSIHSLGEAQ
jgi:cobalt-zinc-cadmium efflux system outer membrane protein